MFSLTPKTAPHHDNLGARCRQIGGRILDGVEATLDELVAADRPAAQRAAIAGAVWAQCAPLFCRQALCRRAQRCRRDPCTVPSPGAAHRRGVACRPR